MDLLHDYIEIDSGDVESIFYFRSKYALSMAARSLRRD